MLVKLPTLLLLAVSVIGTPHAVAAAADPHARAVKLVAQMTLAEKMGFIQGLPRHDSGNGTYVGIVPGVPRLGIPDLRMNDGPQGFRGKVG